LSEGGRGRVEGALDAEAGFAHDVGVELGGGEVFVAEEFLDGADVGAGKQSCSFFCALCASARAFR